MITDPKAGSRKKSILTKSSHFSIFILNLLNGDDCKYSLTVIVISLLGIFIYPLEEGSVVVGFEAMISTQIITVQIKDKTKIEDCYFDCYTAANGNLQSGNGVFSGFAFKYTLTCCHGLTSSRSYLQYSSMTGALLQLDTMTPLHLHIEGNGTCWLRGLDWTLNSTLCLYCRSRYTWWGPGEDGVGGEPGGHPTSWDGKRVGQHLLWAFHSSQRGYSCHLTTSLYSEGTTLHKRGTGLLSQHEQEVGY